MTDKKAHITRVTVLKIAHRSNIDLNYFVCSGFDTNLKIYWPCRNSDDQGSTGPAIILLVPEIFLIT